MYGAGDPPHEVVVDPATQQTVVTGLTWAPVHAAADLAAAVAKCHAASTGDEATAVLTLHVSSGPPAALAARFEAAPGQAGPVSSAAVLGGDGQPRRVAARSGVSTSKLTFVVRGRGERGAGDGGDCRPPRPEQPAQPRSGRRHCTIR